MKTRAFLLAAAALAGCTVGADYRPPEPAIPASFVGPQPASAAGAQVDPARWWSTFNDPTLTALIERALVGSPDIATAASRVRQARQAEIIARADGLPTVDASGNVTHIEFSKNAGLSSIARQFSGGGGGGGGGGGTGAGGGTTDPSNPSGIALPGSGITTFALGFDASWELDLFGGVRRGQQAARARSDAAVWSARDAAVMLTAEVAQAYFALRLDQAQVAVVEQELARQRRSLDIAGNIARVGLVPQLDVTRQRASITATEARLEPLRADIDVRRHAIAILAGDPPATLDATLRVVPPELPAPAPIPVGLPSELLRRRPDVRAAERNLAAATADIGVAVANLYPHFTLTGAAQLISTALSTLFSGNSLQLTGTGAARFPVLDWGRGRATVKQREEDRVQAYETYRATVLGALRDVEDALSRIEAERRRNAALRRAVMDATASARAVTAQYRTGLIAQTPLLDAETEVLSARENLAGSDAQLRQMTASLFKAIGGGWSDDTAATASMKISD